MKKLMLAVCICLVMIAVFAQNPLTDEEQIFTVTEGDLVTIDVSASDPDRDILIYSYSPPLNENGQWQTSIGDAGEYITTVKVSDQELETTTAITIIVNEKNLPPVIDNVKDIEVNEGDLIELDLDITDPNNDDLEITYSGFISDKKHQTTFNDQGEHTATVTAYDGELITAASFTIKINNVNQPPIIEPINDIEIFEEETIFFEFIATDPDGDPVTTNIADWPYSNEFTTNLNDNGEYKVRVFASDGKQTTSSSFNILVKNKNQAPVINPIRPKTIKEGQELTFKISASDPDKDFVNLNIPDIPNGATFINNTFSWTPDYNTVEKGINNYNITVIGTDNEDMTFKNFIISVKNVNRLPIIENVSVNQDIIVGDQSTFFVETFDPDNDNLTYSWKFGYIETIQGNADHTRLFTSPGIKRVKVIVSDGIDVTTHTWEIGVFDLLETRSQEVEYPIIFKKITIPQPDTSKTYIINNKKNEIVFEI